MAVRTREEILNMVRARIGDDTSDEALGFVEDIQDTMADFETRANGDGTDWKKKYEDNDKEWRTKYRERFFSGTPDGEPEPPEDKPKRMTYEALFKEV